MCNNNTFQSEPDKPEDTTNKPKKATRVPNEENNKVTNYIVNINHMGKTKKKEPENVQGKYKE